MINILELIDGGFIGGGQTHIISLVKSLDNKKFSPVIAASPNGGFKNLVWEYNFDFADAELPKLYGIKHLKVLDKIVKEHSIDVIHSHGGVAGMYARFYKKKYGSIKTVHTIHGIHYINSKNIFRKLFSLSIEQYLTRYTDYFICVSEADKKKAGELKIIDVDKTFVINNGIDLKRFARRTKDRSIMNKYRLSMDDFIIGNISRFDFQKNQRFIIRHAKDLLADYPNLKIMLVGDGDYFKDCQYEVNNSSFSDRFIFTGEVLNPEDYYSVFDLFVFPTLWEGLSIMLIEAMASGCTILASDIEANRELLEHGKDGLLFDLNSPGDFMMKFKKLMSDETLRRELSQNAISASVKYSEEDMVKKIEEVYIKVAVK